METASQFWVLESGIRVLVGLAAQSVIMEPIPASSVALGGCWQPLAVEAPASAFIFMSVSKPHLCRSTPYSNRTSS